MKKMLLMVLVVFLIPALLLAAGGDTSKVPQTVEADIQQIIKLPAPLAVAAWIALSPEQRQEILHYSTAQERAAIFDAFESIIEMDGLKPLSEVEADWTKANVARIEAERKAKAAAGPTKEELESAAHDAEIRANNERALKKLRNAGN